MRSCILEWNSQDFGNTLKKQWAAFLIWTTLKNVVKEYQLPSFTPTQIFHYSSQPIVFL